MLRPARFAFMVKREPHPALYFWLTISNGVAGMGSYLNGSRGALTDGNEGWGCSVWITRYSYIGPARCADRMRAMMDSSRETPFWEG